MANTLFRQDLFRYLGGGQSLVNKIFTSYEVRYLKAFRSAGYYKKSNKLLYIYYCLKLRRLSRITQIQIPVTTQIGGGFYIGHCGRVIINPEAIIGENVNIATGVTIGQENRGKRKGTPIIGDKVWIGTNAVIVGKITIGTDVLIAPNAYVNFDVPDHSIVVGNPAKIIARDNATEGYINRTI